MDNEYIQLLKNIKEKIHQAQRKAALSINTEMLQLYWTIGNEISTKIKEAGWGTKVTTQIAKDLKSEFPEMSGFSPRKSSLHAELCRGLSANFATVGCKITNT